LVGIALLAVLILVLAGQTAEATTHDGIRIQRNSEFTAANGVVSGSGTGSDPYIISDWEINRQHDGILIEGTDAYFIVRNITIDANGTYYPLRMNNVRNGVFENIYIYGRENIFLWMNGCQWVTVSNVTIRDGGFINVGYSSDCTLTDVNLPDPGGYADVGYSDRIDMIRCNVTGSDGEGIYIHVVKDLNLIECDVSDHYRGVRSVQSERVAVLRCVLRDNSDYDLDLSNTT
jgi:hypothetical protein